MSGLKDFVIENGVLKKYVGWDDDIVVPNRINSIGVGAFACKSLKSIVLPCGVRSIGFGAFGDCNKLVSVSLPQGLKRIDSEAFKNCESLEELIVPDSCTQIGYGVIIGCSRLRHLVIPKNTWMPDYENVCKGEISLKGCHGLKNEQGFVISNNTVWDYCGKEKELTIPFGIIKIAEEAFKNNKKIEKVIMPESVEIVLHSAFADCKNLKEVVISDSNIGIFDSAFENCGLLQLVAPNFTEWHNILGKNKKYERIIPLAFPKISISKPNDKAYKLCLALGYILHKDLYDKKATAAYEKYCEANRDIILEAAQRNNINLKEIYDNTINEKTFVTQMSQEEAKIQFKIWWLESGYKIRKYLGEEKIVTIPYKIGITDVFKVDEFAFDDDTIIRCSGKLFARLPIKYQINTIVAYLSGEVEFSADQKSAMDTCLRKKTSDIIEYLIETNNITLLQKIFDRAKCDVTLTELDAYLKLANSKKEITTILSQLKDSMCSIKKNDSQNKKELEHTVNFEKWSVKDWGKVYKLTNYKTKYKGNYVIWGYKAKETNLTIPCQIAGIPVAAIECNSFHDDNVLETVVFPNTLQYIQERAFTNCIKLKSVVFTSKETRIDREAFLYCSKFTIHAPAGSYAEQYAKENNIPFVVK